MLSFSRTLVIGTYIPLIVILHGSVLAQDEKGSSPTTAQQTTLKLRLLEEALQIESPGLGDRMSALIGGGSSGDEAGTRVQLARQLDALARDLQIAWLTQGLDDLPLPSNMSDRLATGRTFYRKKVVFNLNEIAKLTLFEANSTPEKKGSLGQPVRSKNVNRPERAVIGRMSSPIGQDRLYVYIQANTSLKFQMIQRSKFIEICDIKKSKSYLFLGWMTLPDRFSLTGAERISMP